jgi:beta-alanine degradation protein BauB
MKSKRLLTFTALSLFAPSPVNSQDATPSETSALPTAFDAGWQGKQVCEPLFENDRVRAARCVFPPGGGHERHFHPPHWGYIVQGGTMRITTKTGSVDRVLKSGANWWSDGIEWHEAVNIGSETAIYIIVEPKNGVK